MNSLQQISETPTDILDYLGEMVERINNRLTLTNPRFVERYLNFELHILLLFKRKAASSVEFIADIQRPSRWPSGSRPFNDFPESGIDVGLACDQPSLISGENAAHLETRGSGNQESVFIDLVKFVESPEKVVPALVRLDLIDSFLDSNSKALYLSPKAGRLVSCLGLRDWKVNNVVGLSGILDGVEFESEVIESAPEVLECVCGNNGNVIGSSTDLLDPHYILSRLRILLEPDSIGILGVKGFEQSMEIVDVLVGPIDF
jgi:hypothetical protein